MDPTLLAVVSIFGAAAVLSTYYGIKRMRAHDEERLAGPPRSEHTFEQDKDASEVREASYRIGRGAGL